MPRFCCTGQADADLHWSEAKTAEKYIRDIETLIRDAIRDCPDVDFRSILDSFDDALCDVVSDIEALEDSVEEFDAEAA